MNIDTPKDRYTPFSMKWRIKFIDNLWSSVKIRGEELKERKKEKKLHYTNKHGVSGESETIETSFLMGGNDGLYRGQYKSGGIDNEGEWGIFYPNQNETDKIKIFAEIHEKIELVYELDKLQSNYSKEGNSLSELEKIEERINAIFTVLFNDNQIMERSPFQSKLIANKFKEYTELHIIDPYSDFSFLFQKLKSENLIYPWKHHEFINWLYNEGIITKKWFDIFKEKGGFKSLDKSISENRLNNFYNVFSLSKSK